MLQASAAGGMNAILAKDILSFDVLVMVVHSLTSLWRTKQQGTKVQVLDFKILLCYVQKSWKMKIWVLKEMK